jgi:hypothetical protein
METLGNILVAKSGSKVAQNYYCEICDYECSKTYNWKKHLLTSKHLQETNGNIVETQKGQIEPNICCQNCNKEFKTRSGLWKHKKQCNIGIINSNNNEANKEDNNAHDNDVQELKIFMKYLMEENSEMKAMMMEVIKNGTYNNTNSNNTHTNSHNKSFNLQFFLNETCKDAMNIMDFVESIQLQLSDLESVGEKGYVEGISDIIIKNLKNLDVTQRPVHCTDKKRETLYVKDDNKWEKDDENIKMHKMIKKVQDKNFRVIKKFKEKYPDYYKSSSKHSDAYNNIIIESMGGRGNNDHEKEERIIKKVAKVVGLDK